MRRRAGPSQACDRGGAGLCPLIWKAPESAVLPRQSGQCGSLQVRRARDGGWPPLRRVYSPGCTEQHPGLLQGKASGLLLQHLLSTNKTGYKLLQVAEASRALVDLVTWAAEGGARQLSWAPSWVSGVGLLHLQLL